MVDWYTQVEVGSDVIRISEPHVNELVAAHFWWLRGNDRDIVIDAGLGVVALREAIPAMFERDPMVLLTHAHLDHVVGHLSSATGPPTRPRRSSWRRVYRRACTARSSTTNWGIDAAGEPVPELMIDVLPGPGYLPRRTHDPGPHA